MLGDITYGRAISLAQVLAPAIAESAAVADVQRCQPTETIQEIIDAGLVRLLTPAIWLCSISPVSLIAAIYYTRSEGSTQSMYSVSRKYAVHSSTTQLTFTQLIRNARERDKEALAMLYQQAFPLIYHYVLVRLDSPDQTEDVVSEVFLEMIEAISNLRSEQEAGFYAWLFQITQRKISKALKQLIRRRSKHLPLADMLIEEDGCLAVELVATDPASDPTASYELRETLEETKNALDNLNEEQRMVITGRFLAGQRIEELAQALGKRPGAVRILQFRALKILAQRLGGVHKSRHKRDQGNTVTRQIKVLSPQQDRVAVLP